MPDPTHLVTGAAGLIGSQAVRHFAARGWHAQGIVYNIREDCSGVA